MNTVNFITKIIEGLSVTLSIHFEYFLVTGLFFVFFYVWRHKKYWDAKIQQHYSAKKHVVRDIKYSFATIVVFGLVIALTIWATKRGLTPMYTPIDKYGYPYYFFSIVLMVFIHDAYFYWTHRLMHWKPLFKYVHKIHHLTLNPTPFSAYAFHPAEAFIEVGIMPLVAFTVPHHLSAIIIFAAYQLFVDVMGHIGYECFPKGFVTHKVFKWSNTSTHHNMHHRFIKCNYGLYFNFWDKLMKTNHPKYIETFNDVVERRERAEEEANMPNEVVLK